MRRASDLQRANAVKSRLPRCGAKCRDGSQCRNPGTGAGGKCPKHGGLTPSGDRWHVPVLPPDGPRRERKLATLTKRRKKRAAEIAAMSPERRAKYEAWHAAARKPGPRVGRVKARQDREAKAILAHRGSAAARERARRDREMRELLARPKPAATADPRDAVDEVAALEAQLADLDQMRERLEAQLKLEQNEESND